MQEIVLKNKKRGMFALIVIIALFVASFALIIGGAISDSPLVLVGVILMFVPMILIPGLKVLKPQEALVLTLFGKYVGTLKGEGFYFVNPFCTAVNPASKTKLNQSGDVNTRALLPAAKANSAEAAELANKKISLKIMTLNNNRQKINDCLGNPVEIGIAVMWKVVDTAKAVFNVDNYKEYLSLQCDSALRNIVRIYPYDIAPGVDTTGDGVATKAVCAVPARWWREGFATRYSKESTRRASKLSRRASPISLTRPKLPPLCYSASRLPLSSTRER